MKKSVLITGVNGGIGEALAIAFKNNGDYVIGIGRRDGSDHCDKYIKCDLNQFVADDSYRKEVTDILHRDISSLNTLINNAAIQILDNFQALKMDDWQMTLNVNLTAPMLFSQLFFNKLRKDQGSIINIGSIHQALTKPNFVSYATSKSALLGLTKSLAVDLNGEVLVNAISPAAIETKMLLDGFNNDKRVLKKLADCHPVKRIGTPEEVAELAIFLSDKNSGFINGANFTLDGGISSLLHDI